MMQLASRLLGISIPFQWISGCNNAERPIDQALISYPEVRQFGEDDSEPVGLIDLSSM
jgi:hypothetical protein